ncbi:MAG: hypothetical protein EBV77_12505, partial [Gemmatimonadaceae bacterium]|nr:hypothetical protein [Gemmatimonadaceae bacterium]
MRGGRDRHEACDGEAVEGSTGIRGPVSAPFNLRIDNAAATLTITSSKSTLKAGEAALLQFNFSEPVSGFSKSTITGVDPSSLGSLQGPMPGANGSVSYSIEYRPLADTESNVTLSVSSDTVTDLVGNELSTQSQSIAVDTRPPSAPQIGTIAGNGVINQAEAQAGVVISGT